MHVCAHAAVRIVLNKDKLMVPVSDQQIVTANLQVHVYARQRMSLSMAAELMHSSVNSFSRNIADYLLSRPVASSMTHAISL